MVNACPHCRGPLGTVRAPRGTHTQRSCESCGWVAMRVVGPYAGKNRFTCLDCGSALQEVSTYTLICLGCSNKFQYAFYTLVRPESYYANLPPPGAIEKRKPIRAKPVPAAEPPAPKAPAAAKAPRPSSPSNPPPPRKRSQRP